MNMGAFPSGQWGQTVNLLLNASVVRLTSSHQKAVAKMCHSFFVVSLKNDELISPFFKRFLQCCPTHKEENHKCALKN